MHACTCFFFFLAMLMSVSFSFALLMMLVQVFCFICCVIVAHQLIQFELLLCKNCVVHVTKRCDNIVVVSFDFDGNVVVAVLCQSWMACLMFGRFIGMFCFVDVSSLGCFCSALLLIGRLTLPLHGAAANQFFV